jgi:hypothetical protein
LDFVKVFVALMLAISSLIFGLISLTGTTQAAIASFSDNFNDNKIDSSRWLTSLVGNGPTVKETNQRLEIVIPSNSLSRTSNSSEVIAGITSTCQLRGDFDFQIDYELLSWPPSNGAFVVLTAQRESVAEKHLKSFQNTERMSLPHLPRDVYATDFDDGLYKVNATSDMSGKLRIVRSGFTITGFYYISDHWVPINSAREGAHADINMKPIAYTKHGLFANKQVKIAFDNAILNKGHLVNCQPSLLSTARAAATAEAASNQTSVTFFNQTAAEAGGETAAANQTNK